MARVIDVSSGGGFVGPFEPRVCEQLKRELPDDFILIPNFQIKHKHLGAFEFDLVVISPHAIYVVEEKEWYGRLSGDDQEWLLNKSPKRCPLWLTNTKCKVLKGELRALANSVYIDPLLIVPDGTQIQINGNWGGHVVHLSSAATWLKDPKRLGPRASNVKPAYAHIEKALLGRMASRNRGPRRRVAGFEIIETLYADDYCGEYIAKRAHFADDTSRFRVRTWRLDRSGTPQAVEKRKAIIRRPTEAVAKIGRHPNLLPVLHFDFIDDDNEFYEVTEWSEYGTLHGYLNNPDREQLTLRERLEIAAGVASALTEIHTSGVVHRNVCPEAVLVGFDHIPRLTDFDRAFLEGNISVFEGTEARRNLAFIPPELENVSAYDFDTASDMYSFGVLLYQLLTDKVPFAKPSEARSSSGIPLKLPSQLREGVDPRLDELILNLLKVSNFHERPSALHAGKALQDLLSAGSSSTDILPPEASPARFEAGSLVDGVWRIDGLLGQGAFSRAYRVFHLDHQKTYAMKLLTNISNQDLTIHEWRDAGKMPTHPNVAKIIWMDRLAPPDQTPYVLYELIEGETIEPYCDGRKRFAWPDVKRVGTELLDGLAAVHAANMVHRDIKPANLLLELPNDRLKLIDFNIATFIGDASGRAGTPRYCPPDAGQPTWAEQDDLFSVGVVLYELIIQRHPYPQDDPSTGSPFFPNDIVPELDALSPELNTFLFKAVQPTRSGRFQSALEMLEALESIEAVYAARAQSVSREGRFPGLTLSPDEAVRRNYNPYVTRLLTLYSQARETNSGTRGLDEIARITYVPTRLDNKLAPAIASGNFRLVIVTGNAGDGKTAFLQQIEKSFHASTTVVGLRSGNGSRWSRDGVDYETNYDGSQDEGDRTSDEVLAQFFAPFEGPTLVGLGKSAARLIAINEGRLLDFLAHSQFAENFVGLNGFVHDALAGKAQPDRALLVNLNLRAVTAGGDESLIEKQLVKMLDDDLWVPCEACEHKTRCPIKHNVDTLGDPASGIETRRRVRRLFEIVHLRRRAHITMRDLRSALSWMILRDHSCDDVAKLLRRRDPGVTKALASLYYPEAFADREPAAMQQRRNRDEFRDERTVDRLVRGLRETDVGLVNLPTLDRRLDYAPHTAVPWMTYERRSNEAEKILGELWNSALKLSDEVELKDVIDSRRAALAHWRRRSFFERRDAGWEQQLPYRSSKTLEEIIEQPVEEKRLDACRRLRDIAIDAMSLTEGLLSSKVSKNFLALRISRIKDAKVRSYRLFPKESFEVRVPSPVNVQYLEYAPDFVELISEYGNGHARLRISLDLLEMLELIRSGYRPTMSDLQGLFVNLLIFRNELLATHFDRLLVTPDDQNFFEIEAQGSSNGIALKLSPHMIPAETSQ
ncbi:serine/threonine protein kinase [Bradyrhizobium sp. JR4.1]|uniref:methylation-associated defense system protein kinase MAD6 n=1 Tax=Bradyrhizobium sp. JR4.1 TaxID=3156372 RepID=UPI0033973124